MTCVQARRIGRSAHGPVPLAERRHFMPAMCVETIKRERRRGVGASAARGVGMACFRLDRPRLGPVRPSHRQRGPTCCRVHDMFHGRSVARRFETMEHLAWRGLWLRRWCFSCARGSAINAGDALLYFLERGWSFDLESARLRYPCKACGSAANVLILPASPPPPLRSTSAQRTWKQETEAFFHAMWAERRKRGRR